MLVPCANLSRSRTIFQTVYKQEIFVLKKRNIWTPKFEPPKFWNTPFGYYFKPSNSKFKKGTPEYKRFWRFWNKVLGLINVPLISYFIVYNPHNIDFSEGFFNIRDWGPLQVERRTVRTLEEDRDKQSEELLKLAEKVNKPFEPIKEDFLLEDLKKFENELEKFRLLNRTDNPGLHLIPKNWMK